MGAIIAGLMIFFVFVSMRVSTPEMKLLYADLSTTDASAIAAELEKNEIPYEVSLDGSRVMASQDDIGRARMLLAAAGLPNGGNMGYELFDKQSGFGTTNFVQNINQVRALEGELSRTISSLGNIRSARIHLVLPQRELFSRDRKAASASVYIGVRPGAQLEREQILSIQSLVSSAVPDLKVSNVTVIDSNGNLLARGGEEEASLMSMKTEELRRSLESRLTQKVEDQVSRVVGFGNVRATVTAEINFDRISTNEELFDPEGQVLRSSQVTEESSLEREAGPEEVSVQNNLPGIGGDLLAENQPSAENSRIEETTNYEISKTIRSTVREVGEIQRLSVAVLVDGTTTVDAEGNEVYQPRSEEELDQIAALVKTAVGFDEERGDLMEVVNLQFVDVDTVDDTFVDDNMLFGFDKSELLDVAEMLTVTIMIILVVMLVLQPMVGRLMSAQEEDAKSDALEADLLAAAAMSPALAAPEDEYEEEEPEQVMVDVAGVEGKVKASAVKKVEEIVLNYPGETVSVIRSWMAQDN